MPAASNWTIRTGATPIQAALVGLSDELERRLDLAQGPHVESREEPAPALSRRGRLRDPRWILEVPLPWEDEDLHPLLEGTHLREGSTVPRAAPPDPVVTHLLADLVPVRVPQRVDLPPEFSDYLPRFVARSNQCVFHRLSSLAARRAVA